MKTPGYNTRIVIFFQANSKGKKAAYRWSGMQLRAFRMKLVEAENLIAQGQADLLASHPLKKELA